MKRTLEIMARMRRLVIEDARQRLTNCLGAEATAAAERRAAAAALAREHAAACAPEAPDQAAEAYAAWLPQGRARLEGAEAALVRAESATGHARAQVGAARAAAEAVQRRIEAERAAERADALRREQSIIDETAGRTSLPGSGKIG